MRGIVIGKVILPIIIGAGVVFTKKVTEKEQLVLSEVMALVNDEKNIIGVEKLKIVKPTIFSGYDEWYVERIDTKEKYQYQKGNVVIIK